VRHGAMGESISVRRTVNDILKQAAPVTVSLVLGGAVIWLLLAFPIGILSALWPRSLIDRITMIFVLIGISVHPVWLGLVFSYFFGFKLGITPIGGYCELWSPATSCGGPVQWAYHMILPWLTFALLFTALYVRMIRATVLEAMHEDYVRTARAKGASEWRIVRSHVLRNAMLPIVTMLGMDIGLAFGGALFVETVYGLPGLGRIAYQALARRDLPVLVGITMWTTLAIVVFNLLIDIVYACVDPRVTVGAAPSEERTARVPRATQTRQSVAESASA
jgi:peptide/nickel transport system permease protein